MATVGLTGGAFYSHFDSKNELLLEIIKRELAVSYERINQQSSQENLANFLNVYLSPSHLKLPEMGCALPSLTTEVGRADDSAKEEFEQGLVKIHHSLTAQLGDAQRAWAVLAMTVGAVSLARGLQTSDTQNSLLNACKEFALQTENE